MFLMLMLLTLQAAKEAQEAAIRRESMRDMSATHPTLYRVSVLQCVAECCSVQFIPPLLIHQHCLNYISMSFATAV